MARIGRRHISGAVVHVITRLDDYRIEGEAERDEFLRRMGNAANRCDWVGLAYAVMSNHCHTAFLAGTSASEQITRSCHTGFASWLNGTQSRRGRVMLCRPTVKYATDTAGAARIIAYVHNNPPKVNRGTLARDSLWTSHRAYLGTMRAPEWVDVELGLALAGFDATPDGRAQFDSFTNARLDDDETDDALLGEVDPRSIRACARDATRLPVELSDPVVVQAGLGYGVVQSAASPARLDVDDPLKVIEASAAALGLPSYMLRERGQRRAVVSARRVALLVWQQTGRPTVIMARALGLSESTASYHRDACSAGERALAREIAERLADGRGSPRSVG